MARATNDGRAVAREVANRIVDTGSAKLHKVSDGRFTFHFSGPVHAHMVPDGWSIEGFSDRGWFAIRRE